jgi:hypothetical protein
MWGRPDEKLLSFSIRTLSKYGSQLRNLYGHQSFTDKYRTLNSAKKTQPLTKINRNLSIISEVVRFKKDTKIQKSAIKYST